VADEAKAPGLASGWRKLVIEHRITLSLAFALVALIFIRPSRTGMLYGVPLIIMGEAIRIWASGHIHKMREVTRTGPYALCRHPLYVGHFLITCGFLFIGSSIPVLAVGLLVFWLIFQPTMEREEGELQKVFDQEYGDYMQQVSRFVPRWHADAMLGGHDWTQVRNHREWNNILGLVAGIAIMAGLGLWHGTW